MTKQIEAIMPTTKNSRIIHASPGKLYSALTDPAALEIWLAPGDMTGKIHWFDLREGGGYLMSLFYPASEKNALGKTASKEDRYTARFIELTPIKKIVEAINFESVNPAFAGEMIMEVTLEPTGDSTEVSFLFRNIPPGIKPADNEAGTVSTLEKLARFVEKD